MVAPGDAARCPEIPRWCHHCAGPLSKDMETSSWTVSPMVRDSFSMIGSAVGGIAGAFYGFNHTMPVVRRYIKGPMWMHFLVGLFYVRILLSIWLAFLLSWPPWRTCIARSSNALAKKPPLVLQKPLKLSLAKPKKKVTSGVNLEMPMRALESLGTVVAAESPFFTAEQDFSSSKVDHDQLELA
ncbi:uncharacterized protein C2845_PM08G08920 [Panicum miliaceum]|uniref:Uncharacterized protein n=1 Tax=Panicum miliaceum TaxID=4540 RepID=A0A3L6R4N4_PANMI|nr:uncharacterized protein C2845_PM08G08920 [Panicum miliaceum]